MTQELPKGDNTQVSDDLNQRVEINEEEEKKEENDPATQDF